MSERLRETTAPTGHGPSGNGSAAARIARPLVIVASTRLALLAIAYAATLILPLPGFVADVWQGGGLISAWNRWDAGWYLLIADRGYVVSPPDPALSLAFFPLYPLAMRLVALIVGDHMLAGLLVSNAAFAVAAVLLHDLTRSRFRVSVADTAVTLLCVYPYAFFYSAVYADSLCLVLALLAFRCADWGRPWLAAACAGLASGARLVGGATGVGLALRALHRPLDGHALALVAVRGLLSEAGMLAFLAYQWVAVGDPFAMVRSSIAWGGYNPVLDGLARLDPMALGPGDYSLVLGINLLLALGFLALVPIVWHRLGGDYGVYALLCIAIPLSQHLEGLGRYLCVVFPAFVALAVLVDRRPLARTLLYAGWAAPLVVLTSLYATGRWIW